MKSITAHGVFGSEELQGVFANKVLMGVAILKKQTGRSLNGS